MKVRITFFRVLVCLFLFASISCDDSGLSSHANRPDTGNNDNEENENNFIYDDILDWTIISNSPFVDGDSINNITYVGGKFFAIGNKVACSDDGIAWSRIRAFDDYPNRSSLIIIYGYGKFIAYGFGSRSPSDASLMYSDDGVNWLSINDNSNFFNSIIYANNTFVAIINGKELGYSDDGVNWTKVSVPSVFPIQIVPLYNSGNYISYGNGLFIIGGINGRMVYSYDNGVTWVAIVDDPFDSNDSIYARITYIGGKFFASSDNKSAYSNDGIRWLPLQASNNISAQNIIYGEGMFVAITNAWNSIIYSNNGITWTTMLDSQFGGGNIYGLSFGGGRFAMIMTHERIAYSNNGVNWEIRINNILGIESGSFSKNIIFGSDRFIIYNKDTGKKAFSNLQYHE